MDSLRRKMLLSLAAPLCITPRAFSRVYGASPAALTILNYNVFNGFRGGATYRAAVEWINSTKPDIAAWQELVGWNEDRLGKAAADWHHPHVAALKGGGYNIGLTSRQPIEVIRRQTAGFWHGYLHCRTAGLDVIVCHLWPGTRRGQLREAQQLKELVTQLAEEGRQVLLMGDFNAHSSRDKPWLDQQQPLIDRRLPGDRKKVDVDRFLLNSAFNCDVMDRILEAPLKDLVRDKFDQAHPMATFAEQLQLGSFPTRVLSHAKTAELQAGFLERIDFVLATPRLASRCKSAEVIRDASVLETTSDHYPVVVRFGPSPPGQR